jgi:hypothetical protein
MFSDQVMGKASLDRLASLVKYYSTKDEDAVDRGVAIRSEHLAKVVDQPLSIRQFSTTSPRLGKLK